MIQNPEPELLDDLVAVAVSGGIDSCVLLHLLHHACLKADRDLVVLHVNHQLRPDARQDAEFVQKTAQKLGRPCHILNIQVRHANSLQAQARNQRYAAMAQALHTLGTHTLYTGHHLDDQRENTLIRRKTGRFGNLDPHRFLPLWNLTLCRPMLHMRRHDITQLAHHWQIPWREDPTNALHTYTRNTIRHTDPSDPETDPTHTPHTLPFRTSPHAWFIASHDLENLHLACQTLPGIQPARRALDALTQSRQACIKGAVIRKFPHGFLIIRTTGQGTRAMPPAPRPPFQKFILENLEF